MGRRHDYTINGVTAAFFGSGSDALGADWCRNFFKYANMEMVSLCRSRDSSFLQNNVYRHRQTK